MAIQTSDAVTSINVAKKNKYADLNLAFLKHPIFADVTPLQDIDAVKQSVKNLVLINFLEKPFHPEIGGNVTRLLFEPADSFTAIAMRDEIQRVLDEYEPRINALNIEILDDSDRNSYRVTIGFNIIYINLETEVSFNLQRLR
jgi:phage baseplate assembly protein W